MAQQSPDEQAVWKLEHDYWNYVKAFDPTSDASDVLVDELACVFDIANREHMDMLERLSGIREGHEALLSWVDGWIESLERGKRDGPRKSKRARKVVRKRERR